MASPEAPRRRDIWLVALGAGRPGEPARTRPALVVSVDELSTGTRGDLIAVVPLSSALAPSALRIEIAPSTGIERSSRAICRAVRAVVPSRLVRRIGRIDPETMEQVAIALGLILGLDHGRAGSGRA